jgi:CO dehydrogenase maturation factor
LTFSIAVAGKGGTGKTTLAALLVRTLREVRVRPILAVDADPNSTLAAALGVDEGRPLAEIREHGSTPEGAPPSGIGRVRAVEDDVQRAITEAEGFDLITMGRPEGPRCYCAVNHLLRKSLDDLARNYEALVLDNEAGMEHLSRRTTNDVDFLIVVMNPTLPSFRAAERILAISRELPVKIGLRAVLLNRRGPQEMPAEIDRQLAALGATTSLRVVPGLSSRAVHSAGKALPDEPAVAPLRLPDVPQDDAVERAGAIGQDVFSLPEHSPALAAVHRVVQALRATAPATPPILAP